MQPDVVTVVPTYNEVDNLAELIDAVLSQGYRVLIVDDASPDGTGRLAERLAESRPGLAVLHRPGKQGLGPAYAEGFRRALDMGAEIVCEMDADLSHDPEELPRLVEAVRGGTDLAVGSRYVPGGSAPDWSPMRRLVSWGGNRYAGLLLGLRIRDATSGFRAFRAEALERLDPGSASASGYGFQVEMVWRAHRMGMEIAEVPITFREREKGRSKMTVGIAGEAMWLVSRWGMSRLGSRLPWSGR